jgi:hypothetical protein
MRNGWRIAMFGLTLVAAGVCPAQSTPQAVPSHRVTKRSQGFLDYVLGKINPNNHDYGSSAADARSELVAYTVRDLYFWSNVVSLALLTGTSMAFVFVLRTQEKREIIAANLIAQLWNGRVVDQREIVRRTRMYNALVEAKNAALDKKAATSADGSSVDATSASSVKEKPSQKSGVQTGAVALKSSTSSVPHGATTGLPSQNWEAKVRLLESQNQALRGTQVNLKERLNQMSQDLEQERRRNQTLKGA